MLSVTWRANQLIYVDDLNLLKFSEGTFSREKEVILDHWALPERTVLGGWWKWEALDNQRAACDRAGRLGRG